MVCATRTYLNGAFLGDELRMGENKKPFAFSPDPSSSIFEMTLALSSGFNGWVTDVPFWEKIMQLNTLCTYVLSTIQNTIVRTYQRNSHLRSFRSSSYEILWKSYTKLTKNPHLFVYQCWLQELVSWDSGLARLERCHGLNIRHVDLSGRTRWDKAVVADQSLAVHAGGQALKSVKSVREAIPLITSSHPLSPRRSRHFVHINWSRYTIFSPFCRTRYKNYPKIIFSAAKTLIYDCYFSTSF